MNYVTPSVKITQEELDLGQTIKASRSLWSRLTEKEVMVIKQLLATTTITNTSRATGVPHDRIKDISSGKTWGHVRA